MDVLEIPVVFDSLRCTTCRGDDEETLFDPALYSRGFFLFRSNNDDLDELKVEVEVSRVRRTLQSSGVYFLEAEYSVRCPQCRTTSVRIEQLAACQLSAFVSLAACAKCGGEAELLTNDLRIEELDEETDSISAVGTFRCTKCDYKKTNPLSVVVHVAAFVRSLLATKSSSTVGHSAGPDLLWDGENQTTINVTDVHSLAPLLTENESNHTFDVALSFAGEDRDRAEGIAQLLTRNGVRVFYDKHEESNLWGKDLYEFLADVYENKARYCIIFVSANYAQKRWTTHERRNAQARAFRENREYILPVKLDDTQLPGLPETIGYMDLRQCEEEEIAQAVVSKLAKLTNR